MVFYNPSLSHNEGEYLVDNGSLSTPYLVFRAVQDVMTVLLGESSLKIWVRVWLTVLMIGTMSPLAFLPHPYAITNLVGMCIIMTLNGRELLRVRGVNKNMGWQHIVGWTPVMVVNILCLSTDWIDDEQLTWNNAGDNAYEQARFVFVVLNTTTSGISILFDFVDTILYHIYGQTSIERSQWTTDQLTRSAPLPLKEKEEEGAVPDATSKTAAVDFYV